MEPLEIEVKFHLPDPEAIHRRIDALGAAPGERIFEHNIRYETEGEGLYAQGALLRLRKDRRARLTYKANTPEADDQYKVRRELEVTVEDFDAMDAILKALGYRHAQIYQKWRRTRRAGDAILCLDEMPFGHFLEIEGPREAIRPMADKLGLDWEERILANYLRIFAIIREDLGLAFTDITFDNFAAHGSIDMTPYLGRLQARSAQAGPNLSQK